MKRFLILAVTLFLFIALCLPSEAWADGKNKRQKKNVPCSAMKGKARKNCEAKQAAAAAAARRRAEEARRRAIARAIAAENAIRKVAADNIRKDNTRGEDLVVRNAVVNAIGNNAATAVVMESQTGKVLTAVNQDWAYRKAFQPCSTIKLVTTVAGLNLGIIDEEDEASQDNLKNALARSKNAYFQKVGSSIDNKDMIEVAKKLGLGKPTGINTDGEASGKIPLIKKTVLTASHGYGYEITPLQQAVMVSTIANHGRKVTPYIPVSSEKGIAPNPKIEQVNLPVKDLDGAVPGMKGAAEFGTAHNGVDFSQGVAGKTGTCSATGTFTSVAPIDNPKYTVVVITRGNAGKGKYAAAIAGRIYQSLLGGSTMTVTAETVKKTEPANVAPKLIN